MARSAVPAATDEAAPPAQNGTAPRHGHAIPSLSIIYTHLRFIYAFAHYMCAIYAPFCQYKHKDNE